MKPYFEKMTPFGKPLTEKQIEAAKENVNSIQGVEKQVAEAVETVKNAGLPEKILKKRGQLNVWERIDYLIDPGTWIDEVVDAFPDIQLSAFFENLFRETRIFDGFNRLGNLLFHPLNTIYVFLGSFDLLFGKGLAKRGHFFKIWFHYFLRLSSFTGWLSGSPVGPER